ncbi:MAG TPA: PilZ domain-containing protein [Acidimicrobiia bacterium]|jgi:c-di-GMP-binding flagellar brake protein YcgR
MGDAAHDRPEEDSGLTRRDGYRVRLDQPVRFYLLDDAGEAAWVGCNLRDVSVSGAAIELVGRELEVGSTILLRIEVSRNAETTFQVRARVVRRVESAARELYGLHFLGLTPSQLEQLHRAVFLWTRRRTSRARW